jgi:hypothetical protein
MPLYYYEAPSNVPIDSSSLFIFVVYLMRTLDCWVLVIISKAAGGFNPPPVQAEMTAGLDARRSTVDERIIVAIVAESKFNSIISLITNSSQIGFLVRTTQHRLYTRLETRNSNLCNDDQNQYSCQFPQDLLSMIRVFLQKRRRKL